MKRQKFTTVVYEYKTEKLGDAHLTFAVISDLHGSLFGPGNQELLQAVLKADPDYVLLTGDLYTRTSPGSLKQAEEFLLRLVQNYPVYYVLGNHEGRHRFFGCPLYLEYEKRLAEAGVRFLHNTSASVPCRGKTITFYGLELPLPFYKKPFCPRLSKEEVDQMLGTPKEEELSVLLAHSPRFGSTYFRWGADLILSGHYHGGLMRIGRHVGITAPHFLPFPRYCCGDFVKGSQTMIVSAGLGEHTIPIRIHNKRELVIVKI